MEASLKKSFRARTLSKKKLYGVLSTESYSMEGYPFGSLVNYCFDCHGNIIMYLSDIAQHTKNINVNNKVSITIIDENNADLQNSARVTILGEIEKYSDASPEIEAYTRFFPESEEYKKIHGFRFYRLNIIRVRFIGGFGDIHWVAHDDFKLSQKFKIDEINSVIEHMNSHHIDSMKKYLNKETKDNPQMVYFDSEGMWIKCDDITSYIPFLETADNINQLRKQLIKMSRQ